MFSPLSCEHERYFVYYTASMSGLNMIVVQSSVKVDRNLLRSKADPHVLYQPELSLRARPECQTTTCLTTIDPEQYHHSSS
jgi:hypothetical protein